MSKKVIVNGMNIGYLPPTNASEINYDNTTSGLTSNNVQDVLDELGGGVNSLEESMNDIDIDNLIQPKQRHYSIASDTEIIDWEPGIHMITISDSQNYLPSNWGTLIKFDTEGAYGCVIFVNTYNEIWRRHFHAVDKSWYGGWVGTKWRLCGTCRHNDPAITIPTEYTEIYIQPIIYHANYHSFFVMKSYMNDYFISIYESASNNLRGKFTFSNNSLSVVLSEVNGWGSLTTPQFLIYGR